MKFKTLWDTLNLMNDINIVVVDSDFCEKRKEHYEWSDFGTVETVDKYEDYFVEKVSVIDGTLTIEVVEEV